MDNSFKIRNGINLGSLTADPANPQSGDFYYNSTTNRFRLYENSAFRDVVSADEIQTLTNKTFGDATTFAQVATPANPASGFNKIYVKSDGSFYTLNSSGIESKLGSGGGGSGKNYLSVMTTSNGTNSGNGDFEDASTNGWLLAYSVVSSSIPTTVLPAGITYNNIYYVFTISGTANATVGATYTNNTQTFTVVSTITAGTTLTCTGTGAPTATGALTLASGTGDASITYTAVTYTGTPFSDSAAISIVNTNQISGSYSLELTNGAGNFQAGRLLMTDAFHIDSSDQAKVLTFKFNYKLVVDNALNFSGTSSNSFLIYIYDVTNGLWIQPAGAFAMDQKTGIGTAVGTFQTTSNSIQYQFAIVINSTISPTATIYFDDFSIGPQTAPIATPVTDPVAYTPTISLSTSVSSNTGFWCRHGKCMIVEGQINFTGVSDTATLTISLPPGYSIDTNYLANGSVTTNQASNLGTVDWFDAGVGWYAESLEYASPTTFTVTAGGQLFNGNQATNGSSIKYRGIIPIVGWSSNVQMSNDTDTRVVALLATGSPPTGSLSNGVQNTVIFGTTDSDTHGAYNKTTGVYTVPVSGYYDIAACVFLAGSYSSYAEGTLIIVVNGTSKFSQLHIDSSSSGSMSFPVEIKSVKLNAGDLVRIDLTPSNWTSFSYGTAITGGSYFSLSRVSGPSVVAATESINITYLATSGQTLTTTGIIKFDTKVLDTHNAYNTSTGVFTAPVSGTYQISYSLFSNTATATWQTFIRVNSLNKFRSQSRAVFSTGTSIVSNQSIQTQPNFALKLIAGDTVDIYNELAITTGALLVSTTDNFLTISKIGN